MFKKKIFTLAAGYLLGGLVTSLYNKKKPGELENELKKSKAEGGSELQILFNDFIDTHKNLLDSLKKEPFYTKNKELINKKKEEFLKIVEDYKKDGVKLINELKVKGKDYSKEIYSKLEELYNAKKDELDTFKDEAPEKIEDLKNKLLASYNETRTKIKEKIEESKKEEK